MKDSLVTVFGGGGFLGRQVAQALMARGARVRVAQRDLATALRVKPLGGLGQTQFVAADITRIAPLMKSANMRANDESIVAKRIASALLAKVSMYFRVWTTDECRYRL